MTPPKDELGAPLKLRQIEYSALSLLETPLWLELWNSVRNSISDPLGVSIIIKTQETLALIKRLPQS